MSRPEWIEVGRVSRPHGVHGEVRVTPHSDNPERFAPGAVVHARPARVGMAGSRLQEQMRLTIDTVRGEGGFPIVGFREVTDRGGAETLRGFVLEVPSSELPELDDDEFYPFDLEQLEARDPEGVVVGRVTEVIESPAHALLAVVLDSGQEVLVPFVSGAVPAVDLAGGYVVVDRHYLEGGEAVGGAERRGKAGGGDDRTDRPARP
jgi:16S rRNA processing protein RimM